MFKNIQFKIILVFFIIGIIIISGLGISFINSLQMIKCKSRRGTGYCRASGTNIKCNTT